MRSVLASIAVASITVATLAGCPPPEVASPTRGLAPTPNHARECELGCSAMGMRMSSVVLIMNSVGCVCDVQSAPGNEPAQSTAPAAAAAAGGAAIAMTAAMLAAQQQQRQRQQQQQQQRQRHYH